jgi:phage shock protein C
MFCTQCGTALEPQDRHCCQCGKPTAAGSPWPANRPARRLTLSRRDKKIAGVCAGVARYLGLDVTLTRIIWLVLVIVPPGLGLISYLIAWLVMPHEESVAATMAEPSAVSR